MSGKPAASEPAEVVRRRPFGSNPLVGERGSDTQRRILEAGLEVFGEVGFDEARVELITQRAGCSRPAFYQYYSSKDDVFWRLAGRLGHEMVALGEQLGRVTADADGVARLTAWVDAFTELHGRYAAVFAAFQAASRDHPTETRASSNISDRLDTALLGAFGLRSGGRNATLAMGTVAMLIRCSFYAESMGGVDRDRLVGALALVIHRLFAGPIDGVNVVAGKRRTARAASAAGHASPSTTTGKAAPTRGAKTRQRLLDAGAAVLPARGYHATRVDDIAAHAGVSHGSFYRYFANKDDFFKAMAQDASGHLIARLDEFPPTADGAAIDEWVRRWFATYQSNGGVISTWQEMQWGDSDLAEFSQRVAVSVIDRLVRVLGQRPFGDPSVDALPLLALTERMPYSVFTLGFVDLDDAVAAMTTIIRRGFFAL